MKVIFAGVTELEHEAWGGDCIVEINGIYYDKIPVGKDLIYETDESELNISVSKTHSGGSLVSKVEKKILLTNDILVTYFPSQLVTQEGNLIIEKYDDSTFENRNKITSSLLEKEKKEKVESQIEYEKREKKVTRYLILFFLLLFLSTILAQCSIMSI